MSPRIAYWTSSFRPEMEAVASEVALLRSAFPRSIAWGISARDGCRLSWRHGFAFSPCFRVPFFLISRMAQCAFHVNHIFGGLGDWLHLRSASKMPTILTVALQSPVCDAKLLKRIDRFVVEWPQAKEQLLDLGVLRERIRLVYPPVDIAKFKPSPGPGGRFTVLFASSPDRSDWLSARGVDLLLDAAAQCPDLRFRLIWRPWGDSLPELRRWVEKRGLRNVEIVHRRIANMEACYQEAHVTVAPFRDPERCKASPNSIIESMACGRPVVVTAHVGLANVIQEWNAGLLATEDAVDLAEKLRGVQANWPVMAGNARSLAENCFGSARFVDSYRRIYAEML